MINDDLSTRLRNSIADMERRIESSVILNPVENIPFAADLAPTAGRIHGLYNSDKIRTGAERLGTEIQFAGRSQLERDSQAIYAAWASRLHAEEATLRLLSGLHAHIVLFMSMARAGESVLLLPVDAGGHLSGRAILERLGLTVIDMAVDSDARCVDVEATRKIIAEQKPDYVLVDRSEGLVYEDFSFLAKVEGATTIFDGSQYLTNIVAGDHPNPLEWGFDLMVASTHKNFPGPQKALLATRVADDRWRRILSGVSTYVSNMHVTSTYAAGLAIGRSDWLSQYSRRMLDVAVGLESQLVERSVPMVIRPTGQVPTHHLWIAEASREKAFETYEQLEHCGIDTNFRLLPYGIGHGIRLGVNAIARLGFDSVDIPQLADIIAELRRVGATPELKQEAREFGRALWLRNDSE